ncbi:MAG: FG-GAP-like repeat-containing protein [Candidatus Andersenbacteria bacterium]
MLNVHGRSSIKGVPQRARLRIRRRAVPLHTVLPTIRYLAAVTLIVALLVGGIRFLTSPQQVGALEFTSHIVGIESAAVGILGVAMADMDNDGDQDVVTGGLDGIKVYNNTGKFNFEVVIIDDARDAERVQVVDFNKDGEKDILVTTKEPSEAVRWYRNDGQLQFMGITLVSSGDKPVAHASDLDGDSFPDIVVARELGGNVRLSRLINSGTGTFTETVLQDDAKVSAVTAGDLDGNGYHDIVTGGASGLQRWKTTDGFTWSRESIDDDNQNRSHIVVADSGDGRTFIVTGDMEKNVLAVYRTQDGIGFQRIQLSGDADAATVAPVDLDGDGDVDIVVAAQDDNALFFFENIGSDEWTKRTITTNLQSVFGVAVGDLDGDHDLDLVAGDHFRGNLVAQERIRVKPVATKPTNIQQSTVGTGIVTFETTISDGDLDPSRVRVQYSLDGVRWDKPWITKVTPSAGSVDLKNSNGYQVGTANAIDTNTHEAVTLTFTWDTKSVQNTGGPLTGDRGGVQLRVLPRDSKMVGEHAVSGRFRVDNQAPQGLNSFQLTTIAADQATFSWKAPTDSNLFRYKIYFGTDQAAVLEQRSDDWDSDDDPDLSDIEATTTTITGLTARTTYTFKLVVIDDFGNSSAVPSVRATTLAPGEVAPVPTASSDPLASPGSSPLPSATPVGTPQPSSSPGDFPEPSASVSPFPTVSVSPSPSPSPSGSPSVLRDNTAPVGDAGPDKIVNPSALVILDGTASFDSDRDSLLYTWRQVDGPRVDLASDRTATPSFSAGGENETYIFSLTVRDTNGASAVDYVTVATRSLPDAEQTPVETGEPEVPEPVEVVAPPLVRNLLHPLDLLLFVLSLFSTLLLVFERIMHAVRRGVKGTYMTTAVPAERAEPRGRVVHYKTGEPIAGAQILIYGQDGKLRTTERTNEQGYFATFFPTGQYTLGVEAEGFTFAPTAGRGLAPEGSMVYTGGYLTVRDANKPLAIVIPLKPTATEVTSSRVRLLHGWQTLQYLGRVFSWPIFLAGALLNTVLVFLVPRPLYLVIEVIYIVLVIIKIALEVRVRPAYGQVRDAITHVPLDLAVVRLFEQGTNRLVMTRVTNNQGKFFALPPAGKYTVTISKPGYATFSKDAVEIKSEHDTTLQMIADLMPVAPPVGGLAHARGAVL